MNIGIQLYTIRDRMTTEADIAASFRALGEMGYTEAQTAGDFIIPPERFAKYAHDAGISIIGTHYDWYKIKDDTAATAEMHLCDLGTNNVGIGGMPKEARGSLDELLQFIEDMNETARTLQGFGCNLTYHNHSFEFKKIAGRTLMDYLLEGLTEPNIRFVPDTYWLQHGGIDVRRFLERISGRIEILHIKDMGACGGEKGNAPYITDVGSGNLNFADIVATAEACGTKYYCVEQDGNYPVDSMTSAKTSFDYLRANVLK